MILDHMMKNGPYKNEGISLKTLMENPHGIDLGPLKPILPHRLFTKDKKIALAPLSLINDLQRLKQKFNSWKNEKDSDFPFYLIGRRHLRSNNSWMHNSLRLVKGKHRCTVLINENDASKMNLKDQQTVDVTSNVGTINLPVETSNDIMQGVVSIPHGWGHNYKNIKMEISQNNAGVSINDLTDTKRVDELTGNADFSGTKVRISNTVL